MGTKRLTSRPSLSRRTPPARRIRVAAPMALILLLAGGALWVPPLHAQTSPLTIQPSTGRVGIGTTGPVRRLTVAGNGAGNANIALSDTSQGGDLRNFVLDNRNQIFAIGTDNDAGNNFIPRVNVTRAGA